MSKGTMGEVTAVVAGVLVALAAATVPMAATAKDGDVIRRGACTLGADWKLRLSPENGRIEVEFEVDQDRVGQRWNVRLKRDGRVFWRGTRVTRAPSGSFEVRRLTRNGPGTERILARARDPQTGEVCRGTARFRS